ncbi:MAG: MGMT family protein, partial [Methanosphaera sp.]|nr:MGMT family protein [Methanosphaera sp.]
MTTFKYVLINSLIGEIGIVWEDSTEILKQIILPDVNTGKFNYGDIDYHGVVSEKNPSDYIYSLMRDIKDVVLGNKVKFKLEQMDLSNLTDFQYDVLIKQMEIPYGKVTSYKKLALLIGRENSARPVANVLATNPFPLVIPCHRTLRADWTIGGYVGTSDGSIKRMILENEHIVFDENDIAKKEYRYPSGTI